MTLEERFARHLGTCVPEGARCLVAVSGGGDSVALLHLLGRHRQVEVAHLDHMLRPESAEDRRFVRRLAARLGLRAHTARADVAAWAERRGLSREEAGRRLRYRYLQEVCRRTGCDLILTAHTADDQAETVLLRVLSGTGVGGLGAILPRRRDGVVRPLLPYGREELRSWLVTQGHEWREDATNAVPEAPRTRVRLLLMPLLREWNPRVAQALARLARAAREDERHLRRLARRHLERHGLDVARLRAASRAIRSRVLRRAAGAPLEARHLRALDALLRGGPEVWLPGGRVARVAGSRLAIEAPPPRKSPPAEVALPEGPFDLALPEWGLRLAARPGWAPPTEGDVTLDVPGPLRLRTRRPGDRFHGPGGTTTLKKFLHARGVPREERDRVALLVCADRIVWVVGHRADPDFLARQEGPSVLRFTAERSASAPAEAAAP